MDSMRRCKRFKRAQALHFKAMSVPGANGNPVFAQEGSPRHEGGQATAGEKARDRLKSTESYASFHEVPYWCICMQCSHNENIFFNNIVLILKAHTYGLNFLRTQF